MSIDSINSSIKRISTDISSLNKKLSDEYKIESSKLMEIQRIQKSINKNTSPALFKSKQSQIDRCNTAIATSKKKQGEITKKLSERQLALTREQEKLSKEQTRISAMQTTAILRQQ